MDTPRHAVILVAGQGNRLRPFTLTNPKCFATVKNRRILENALDSLAEQGCQRVNLVIGHHADVIISSITTNYSGMQISYVVNEHYQTTNSMFSLALGLESVKESTWILEGDVFFEQPILNIKTQAEINWFVDSSCRLFDGAYIESDSQNKAVVLEIVKDTASLRQNQNKSVGILKVSYFGLEEIKYWLQEGIRQDRANDYYDLILADHMPEEFISICDVKGYKWYEIDNQEDLENANRLFAS
jgi:L-glutamine-phosphate cytidylyltransferase